MKLLTIGDPNLDEICKKYNCTLDEIFIIADKPKRMIYKKLGLVNVYYIDKVNDIEEYKRILGEIGMKFDKVIMNPPYEKNLHLKVLEEVLKYIDDDGEVINLSPVRWLQDPLAEDKNGSDYIRFKDSVYDKIESIDVLDSKLSKNFFDAVITMDLGIYHLKKTNNKEISCLIRNKDLIKKITSKIIDDRNFDKLNVVRYNDLLKNYVVIDRISTDSKYGRKHLFGLKEYCGYFINGKNSNGNNYREEKDNNRFASRGNSYNSDCVVFDTAEETINCWKAFHTDFVKFVVSQLVVDTNIYSKYLPFMQDYTQPWTNERFYKYFNITKEEQKIIEDTMKEYE